MRPQPKTSHPKTPRPKTWIYALITVAVAIFLICWSNTVGWQPLKSLTEQDRLIRVFAISETASSARSVGLFIVAHIAATAVGLPGTMLVVVGGAVYGLWWGTLWSVIGATLGAVAAFGLARYLLYDWFKQRFHHRPVLKALNQTLCRSGLSCVLTVRFSPISPFNVVNFVFGLTAVPLRSYALGTFIGIIPGTWVYTWLGVSGLAALKGGALLPFMLCLMLLMLLSLMPLLAQRAS